MNQNLCCDISEVIARMELRDISLLGREHLSGPVLNLNVKSKTLKTKG